MNFLNLGLGELLGIVGVVSAGVVALYLFDRSKRKQLVSTLRFWINADVRTELKHRRRIQQPWSLLLQLLSLALLLTAIAGPQLGVFDTSGRDHVIVLDTSAWMGSRFVQGNQRGILMDEAKAAARAYLKSVPLRDRVMIVRADALATPATAFEPDRGKIDAAIQDSQPTASALSLSQALTFAQHAQQQSKKPGEIVFIGAGRVAEEEASLSQFPTNLRVIETESNQENIGLRKIGMRRSPEDPDTWDIFVAVHNYGSRPHKTDLELQFAKSPAGSKRISLPPGGEEQETFHYQEKAGGFLQARLNVKDGFPQDDRAQIEVPPQASTKAVVYTNEPNLLKALFASDPQVETDFEPTDKYDANVKADVVVLDRFIPPSSPRGNAIWIEPPALGSPLKVRSTLTGVALDKWHTDTAIGAGLRTRDVTLESSEILVPGEGDTVVAEAAAGPVIVARKGEPKYVVIGFHPGKGSMKNELATPLLIANTIRWMAPGTYRQWEVQARTVGTVDVPVEKGTTPESVKVLDASDRALPFTIEDDTLRFFSGATGTVRVQMGDREVVYSLTLPDVGEAVWKVPPGVKRGIPKPLMADALPTNLWPWLAVLGGLGLLIDWFLYGRSRALKLRVSKVVPWRKAA